MGRFGPIPKSAVVASAVELLKGENSSTKRKTEGDSVELARGREQLSQQDIEEELSRLKSENRVLMEQLMEMGMMHTVATLSMQQQDLLPIADLPMELKSLKEREKERREKAKQLLSQKKRKMEDVTDWFEGQEGILKVQRQEPKQLVQQETQEMKKEEEDGGKLGGSQEETTGEMDVDSIQNDDEGGSVESEIDNNSNKVEDDEQSLSQKEKSPIKSNIENDKNESVHNDDEIYQKFVDQLRESENDDEQDQVVGEDKQVNQDTPDSQLQDVEPDNVQPETIQSPPQDNQKTEEDLQSPKVDESVEPQKEEVKQQPKTAFFIKKNTFNFFASKKTSFTYVPKNKKKEDGHEIIPTITEVNLAEIEKRTAIKVDVEKSPQMKANAPGQIGGLRPVDSDIPPPPPPPPPLDPPKSQVNQYKGENEEYKVQPLAPVQNQQISAANIPAMPTPNSFSFPPPMPTSQRPPPPSQFAPIQYRPHQQQQVQQSNQFQQHQGRGPPPPAPPSFMGQQQSVPNHPVNVFMGQTKGQQPPPPQGRPPSPGSHMRPPPAHLPQPQRPPPQMGAVMPQPQALGPPRPTPAPPGPAPPPRGPAPPLRGPAPPPRGLPPPPRGLGLPPQGPAPPPRGPAIPPQTQQFQPPPAPQLSRMSQPSLSNSKPSSQDQEYKIDDFDDEENKALFQRIQQNNKQPQFPQPPLPMIRPPGLPPQRGLRPPPFQHMERPSTVPGRGNPHGNQRNNLDNYNPLNLTKLQGQLPVFNSNMPMGMNNSVGGARPPFPPHPNPRMMPPRPGSMRPPRPDQPFLRPNY